MEGDNMQKKSRWKKMLLLTGGGIIAFFLLLFLFVQLFADDIGERLLRMVQAQAKTRIEVRNVRVSLFPYFPSAAIRLEHVFVEGSRGDTLLVADDIAFRISLFSLLRSRVNLETVRIKDGKLSLHRDKKGLWNYDIFRQDTTGTEDSDLSLSIRTAQLDRVELFYRDDQLNNVCEIYLVQSVLNGSFGEQQFDLAAKAESVIDRIWVDSVSYLQNKPVSFDLKAQVDLATGIYTLDSSRVVLSDNTFVLMGSLRSGEKQSDIQLKAYTENAVLRHILQLLPPAQLNFVGQLEPDGEVDLQVDISGPLSARQIPEIKATAQLSKGSLRSRKWDTRVEDVALTASYQHNARQASLSCDLSQGKFQGKPARMQLQAEWGARNHIDLTADLEMPVALPLGLGGGQAIRSAKGSLSMQQVRIKGNPQLRGSLQCAGMIQSDGIGVQWDKYSLETEAFRIDVDPRTLRIDQLALDGLESVVQMKGRVNNYMQWFFPEKGVVTDIECEIVAERLNLDLWMAAFSPSTADTAALAAAEDLRAAEPWWGRTQVQCMLDLQGVIYSGVPIAALKGELRNQQEKLSGKFQASAFDGQVDGQVHLVMRAPMRLEGKFSGKQLDINRLFEECREFDQRFLTSRNLKGRLESKLFLDARWNDQGEFLPDQLQIDAGMRIADGELNDMAMLEDFSKYVKIQDLKRIKFTTLHNLLEIRGGTVRLPVMFIQSNALNMNVQGIHSFDNKLSYYLQINAGQVLVNRFKKHNPDLEPIAARENGVFNIYYKISGTPDQLQYAANRRAVEEAFRQSDLERDKVRDRLVRQFGHSELFYDPSVSKLDYFSDESPGEEQYIDF